ncbi:MAG TPA: S1 family peptidase [Pseudonocardiaceae bacterium]
MRMHRALTVLAALAAAVPLTAAPAFPAVATVSAAEPAAVAAVAAAGSAAGSVAVAAVDRLARQAVPDSVASWHADGGALVVSVVGKGDAAADGFAAAARSVAGVPVRVVPGAERPVPFWDIKGGQPLYLGGTRCTIGYNAGDNSGGRYIITAGHCTNLGGSGTGIGGSLGPVGGSSFPGNDYGVIRVTSTSAVSTPWITRHGAGPDIGVSSDTTPVNVGQRVCFSGSTSGWRCGGVVRAVNVTVNYGDGNVVGGLISTSLCAQPGDSGGPVVGDPGAGLRAPALGIISGGTTCGSSQTLFSQPVREILQAYGLRLYLAP